LNPQRDVLNTQMDRSVLGRRSSCPWPAARVETRRTQGKDGGVVTTGRSTRVGAVVLAALALSGCASQACTTVGCESAISVDVSAVQGLGATQSGRIRVCLGTTPTCVLALAPKGQSIVEVVFPTGTIPGPGIEVDKPVAVTVSVLNPGTVLVEDTVDTTFTKLAPNGESCGPICYRARVVATDRGVTPLPMGASASPSS
jgi:hypothetical protein